MSHPADPPIPLPEWLLLTRAPLSDGDLCIALSTRELDAVHAALRALDVGDAQLRIVQRDGSPWVEIDLVTIPPDMGEPHSRERAERIMDTMMRRRLALWRWTCAVYELDINGAVIDEAIYRPDEGA